MLVLLPGCAVRQAAVPAAPTSLPVDVLAPGVVHRAIPTGPDAGVDVIDIDLAHAAARPAIVAGLARQGLGPAFTPEDWLTQTHALAAVNGGYFGRDDGAGHEEFVGLLVRQDHVVQAALPLQGHGSATLAPGRFVRSAFGLTRAGLPQIAWVSSVPRLCSFTSPLITHSRVRPWPIWNAVGCGPTLIQNAHSVVTDRRERLASPGPQPRTFVAYDGPAGHPRHFVLGVASAMTFSDLAAFLQDYFSRTDHTQAQAAMCLDGGASSQLSYRLGPQVLSPRFTGVAVPDAVVIENH